MSNNTLLDKLETLQFRFEEVATLITDPETIADQRRYVKLYCRGKGDIGE